VEIAMRKSRIPQTDSIKELAEFWDTHDFTDFADELKEVTEPVFGRKPAVTVTGNVGEQKARGKHYTSWAGVLATAAELSRRSYDVTITFGNTPTTDLLAAAPDGSTFRIEVKSASTPNFVPIQRNILESPNRSDLVVVVVLVPRKQEERFRFFIMRHDDVRNAWQTTRKTNKSGEPYKPGWEGLNWGTITPFESCWDKLPGATSRPAA
jgi:hypothetical protein